MKSPARPRSLVLTFGPTHDKPWWWQHVDLSGIGCTLDYGRASLGTKNASQVSTRELPAVIAQVARVLRQKGGRNVEYVFTFECDLSSFAVALLQTLTFRRRPRHVIVQFIMREKRPTLMSRLKYLFMKFCFASVYRVVCSSRPECEYYRKAFGWKASKLAYAPLHTSPNLLKHPSIEEKDFIIAAGRTMRDYPTFLAAVEGLPIRVVIVAGRDFARHNTLPANVELRCDIPFPELAELISSSKLVVLPLEDREISIGQSVLLQAMALGKAVIATRTAGTVDYITHGEDGMLVPPKDPAALRAAIVQLLNDPDLRKRIAERGLRAVREQYLPQHYVDNVAKLLQDSA